MYFIKNYKTVKIKYGSTANLNPNEEERRGGLTHEWRLFVKAPAEFIKSVTYKLHESFLNNNITIPYDERNPDFKLEQKGWGEFTVQIKITLFNNDKLQLTHYLQLHETKKNNMISDTINSKVISTREDTVFYKGKFTAKNWESKFTNENEELKRIDKCIDYVLQEIERYL